MRQAVLAVAVLAAVAAGGTASSYAGDAWQNHHPRRAEVNGRLLNQNARINSERRSGQINAQQAHQLHAQDHQIRQEERNMASQHDGHITLGEQASLNHQENATSQEIGR